MVSSPDPLHPRAPGESSLRMCSNHLDLALYGNYLHIPVVYTTDLDTNFSLPFLTQNTKIHKQADWFFRKKQTIQSLWPQHSSSNLSVADSSHQPPTFHVCLSPGHQMTDVFCFIFFSCDAGEQPLDLAPVRKTRERCATSPVHPAVGRFGRGWFC